MTNKTVYTKEISVCEYTRRFVEKYSEHPYI